MNSSISYGIIYKVTNEVNGKTYIGQTIKKEKKFEEYFGSGVLIRKAIRKYGINNFSKEVLTIAKSSSQLNRLEKIYIALLRPEYNIAEGGLGGNNTKYYSVEQKELHKNKISLGMKNRSIESIQETNNKIRVSSLRRFQNETQEQYQARIATWKKTYHGKSLEDKKKESQKRSKALFSFWSSLSEKEKKEILSKRYLTFSETIQKRTEKEKIDITNNYRKASIEREKKLKNSLVKKQAIIKRKAIYNQKSKAEKEKIVEKRLISLGNKLAGGSNPRAKKVVCLETNQVFNFIGQAAESLYGNRNKHFWIIKSIKSKCPINNYSWEYYNE